MLFLCINLANFETESDELFSNYSRCIALAENLHA